MKALSLLFLGFVLAGAAANGMAVEVLEATGSLQQHIWAMPTPVPGYCYWEAPEPPGTALQATNAEGYGNMDCPDPWLIHCDGDSLVYRGSWPLNDGEFVRGAEYVVDLSCTVELFESTILDADRAVVGALSTDEHTATLEYPDGSNVPLLIANAGPDQIQLVLEPGVYRLSLLVNASQYKNLDTVIQPYEGRISVTWSDSGSLPVESVNWGSLKAGFERR